MVVSSYRKFGIGSIDIGGFVMCRWVSDFVRKIRGLQSAGFEVWGGCLWFRLPSGSVGAERSRPGGRLGQRFRELWLE
jgi:hypothetical protein